MDYKKEKESLQTGEQADWFKPTIGKHDIVFLSEGEPYTIVWEEKEIDKVKFLVEVKKKQYQWGVTKGKTETSLYGQIILVGANKEKLAGEKIILTVIGESKDRKYVVDEAIPLMTPKEERV